MRIAIAALLVGCASVVTGCGSSVLHISRTVEAPTPGHGSGHAHGAVLIALDRLGRAWEVGTDGSLFVGDPGGMLRRVGVLPSPDPQTGKGYVPYHGFSVDPSNPKILYVDSDGLYVSRDGGHTWSGTKRGAGGVWNGSVLARASAVYALRAPDSHPCGSCDHGPYPFRLYSSANHGLTWRKVSDYRNGEVNGLAPASLPAAVFVATSSGLFLHRPGREDVERDVGMQRSYGLPPSITSLVASGPNQSTLYATTSTGENDLVAQVYASADHGLHWHLRRSPFRGNEGALFSDPTDPNTAFAVVYTQNLSGFAGYGAYDPVASLVSNPWRAKAEIFRTGDGAKSWLQIWRGCLRGATPGRLVGPNHALAVQTCTGRIARIPTNPRGH